MNTSFLGVCPLILQDISRVARNLLMMHGKEVPETYPFHEAAIGSLEKKCWNAATVAYYNFIYHKSGVTPKTDVGPGSMVPLSQGNNRAESVVIL